MIDWVEVCDHEWRFEAGDWDVGINAGWVCDICDATNDDPPPDDDWPSEWSPWAADP